MSQKDTATRVQELIVALAAASIIDEAEIQKRMKAWYNVNGWMPAEDEIIADQSDDELMTNSSTLREFVLAARAIILDQEEPKS